jgi:hypothetical protein
MFFLKSWCTLCPQEFCFLGLYLTACLLFHCTALNSQDRHKTYVACPITGNTPNAHEIHISDLSSTVGTDMLYLL